MIGLLGSSGDMLFWLLLCFYASLYESGFGKIVILGVIILGLVFDAWFFGSWFLLPFLFFLGVHGSSVLPSREFLILIGVAMGGRLLGKCVSRYWELTLRNEDGLRKVRGPQMGGLDLEEGEKRERSVVSLPASLDRQPNSFPH